MNEVYGVLDEIGTLNASWTQVCGTVHDLAAQVDCLSVAQDCSSDRGITACGIFDVSNNPRLAVYL